MSTHQGERSKMRSNVDSEEGNFVLRIFLGFSDKASASLHKNPRGHLILSLPQEDGTKQEKVFQENKRRGVGFFGGLIVT